MSSSSSAIANAGDKSSTRIVSAISVTTGFLILIFAFLFVGRWTRQLEHLEGRHRASMRGEAREVEVPEMWEVERVGGKGEEEVGELMPLSAHLHPLPPSSSTFEKDGGERSSSSTQHQTHEDDAKVVVVAFLLRLPGIVSPEDGEEEVLMDLEIGVVKWRVEGELTELG